jgi:5-methylcytosine-specific restriction protein A
MPKRANMPCRKIGCSQYAIHKGFCDNHKSFATGWHLNEQRNGNRHKRGYGTSWEKLRKVILRRDLYLCQEHLRKGMYVEGNHVDHIMPKSLGGTDEQGNLQTLCKPCHETKTANEQGRGGRK